MENLSFITGIDEREVVLAYLERERDIWLPARARALRAGHNNAALNLAESQSMERMNGLLDELGALVIKEVTE